MSSLPRPATLRPGARHDPNPDAHTDDPAGGTRATTFRSLARSLVGTPTSAPSWQPT